MSMLASEISCSPTRSRTKRGFGETSCPVSLERVLQNLLVNAVRHTDEGEVVLTARVEVVDVVIDKRPHIAGNAYDHYDAAGIPLRMMTYVLEPRANGSTHVLVAAEFDGNRLGADKGDGSLQAASSRGERDPAVSNHAGYA